MTKTELGLPLGLTSTKEAADLGRLAEKIGFDRVAIPDTKPKAFHACYPAMTALFLQTERIIVGPHVSNPVTRHWSVQASTLRAFEELVPGRYFLGLGTGDGSVHSVGLRPAMLADMEEYIRQMRTIAPPTSNLHMAFSGHKGMALAGRHASEVTIGTGLDVSALREMARRARAARALAGVRDHLGTWIHILIYVVDSPADAERMRRNCAGLACHLGRFALDFSFEGKNVPESFQPVIRECMKQYGFAYHGTFGDTPNGRLFDDHPEIREYLLDRFC